MALWVNIGKNAKKVEQQVKQNGIFLLAEHAFHLNKSNDQDKYIRLGFAGQSEEKMREGLLLLKPFLNKPE
jgi:GntR family transcriptional regulator/MocR family aminotransferase